MLKKEFANENGMKRSVMVDAPTHPQLVCEGESHPEVAIGYKVRGSVSQIRMLLVEALTISKEGVLERTKDPLFSVEKRIPTGVKELGEGVANVRRLSMEQIIISPEGALQREESQHYDLTLNGPALPEYVKQAIRHEAAHALDSTPAHSKANYAPAAPSSSCAFGASTSEAS